jgi:hypothetical protein
VVGPLLAARALPLRCAAALLVKTANWAGLAPRQGEILDDTKDEQTGRSDIDETAATKRQNSNNKRSLKVTRLASSEKYTVNGKLVQTERFRVEEKGQKDFELERHKGVFFVPFQRTKTGSSS